MSRKKTAAEHIRDGDPRGKGVHKLDQMAAHEPKTESGLPERSPRLTGDAQAAYEFYRQQLILSDLAAQPDVYALERACQNLALMWRADRALQREGPIRRVAIMSGRGNARKRIGFHQVRNRWLNVRIDAEKQFHRFAAAFGLTGPSSRAGLEVAHSDEGRRELLKLLTEPRLPKKADPIDKPC